MSQEITFAYTDSGEVIAAGVVLPFVGLACLGLRFAARAGKKNNIGIDDWLVVPSWVRGEHFEWDNETERTIAVCHRDGHLPGDWYY